MAKLYIENLNPDQASSTVVRIYRIEGHDPLTMTDDFVADHSDGASYACHLKALVPTAVMNWGSFETTAELNGVINPSASFTDTAGMNEELENLGYRVVEFIDWVKPEEEQPPVVPDEEPEPEPEYFPTTAPPRAMFELDGGMADMEGETDYLRVTIRNSLTDSETFEGGIASVMDACANSGVLMYADNDRLYLGTVPNRAVCIVEITMTNVTHFRTVDYGVSDQRYANETLEVTSSTTGKVNLMWDPNLQSIYMMTPLYIGGANGDVGDYIWANAGKQVSGGSILSAMTIETDYTSICTTANNPTACRTSNQISEWIAFNTENVGEGYIIAPYIGEMQWGVYSAVSGWTLTLDEYKHLAIPVDENSTYGYIIPTYAEQS